MANWIVDAAHSDVQFKVKHLMINTVTGEFTNYSVDVESEAPDFSDAVVRFEASVDSISTKNEMRDGHLKSPDFFDAASFPKLSFVSTSLTPSSDGTFTLTGDFTIRDITRPITLKGEFGGTILDFYGNTKAGFELSGSINRKDFGLLWNGVTEAGGIVVSDEVRLLVNVQLMKVVPAQEAEATA